MWIKCETDEQVENFRAWHKKPNVKFAHFPALINSNGKDFSYNFNNSNIISYQDALEKVEIIAGVNKVYEIEWNFGYDYNFSILRICKNDKILLNLGIGNNYFSIEQVNNILSTLNINATIVEKTVYRLKS